MGQGSGWIKGRLGVGLRDTGVYEIRIPLLAGHASFTLTDLHINIKQNNGVVEERSKNFLYLPLLPGLGWPVGCSGGYVSIPALLRPALDGIGPL